MKKNLSILTGIVFVITILAAGACKNGSKQGAEAEAEKTSKYVDIFLKAVLIDSIMHLEMYDSKNEGCIVIDGLLTTVDPGETARWMKASNSKITKIVAIIQKEETRNIFDNLDTEEGPDSLWTLLIPNTAIPDTIPYGIKFRVAEYGDSIFTIDPYLRIPPPDEN